MNEKGSMTKEELENYFMNHFAKLFPDKADLPGYRVAVLIDGGPGRTNLEMLAKLRLMGILLFPSGPPNTTALLQIMDQLFGLFKTVFLQNFQLLWEFRLNLPADDSRHERIGKNDIGLLMFGGILPDVTVLRDAFDLAFSAEKVRKEWAKAGINPFTREALQSSKIRHEISEDLEGEDADPKAAYLKELQELNSTCCSILDCFGYDGGRFRIILPVRDIQARRMAVTKAHTRERQDAITSAKSQGALFQKTGGSTGNGDDVFISAERRELRVELDKLRKQKESNYERSKRQHKAQEILQAKPDGPYNNDDLKNLISWKTGKPCPSNISRVADRRNKWTEVKDLPVPACGWSATDQEKISQLEIKIDNLPIEETILARKKAEALEMLFATLPTLTGEELQRAKAALGEDVDVVTDAQAV
jgi:hypothetical protein